MLCLFDLDGTLIDSEQGITACIRHALARLDLPLPRPAELRRWIGPPLRQSFAPLLDHDADRIEAAVGYYHERFDTLGWHEHAVYPGIEALIRQLRAAYHRLVVVTSKPRQHAAPIVAQLPFGDAFEDLYGPHPGSAHSEKATLIADALRDFACPPAHAVMIGDRHFDIEGAVANQVRGIGVLWGFGDRNELQQAGASAMVATPAELGQLLLA
ncbi:MAG TPA: HAD hydrolase-like protein [Rhodanobacter sp.]|nr:HAD hydrolase-like protein [Rhodanobacter sp.]